VAEPAQSAVFGVLGKAKITTAVLFLNALAALQIRALAS
jgi:hypothetical protein